MVPLSGKETTMWTQKAIAAGIMAASLAFPATASAALPENAAENYGKPNCLSASNVAGTIPRAENRSVEFSTNTPFFELLRLLRILR